MSFHTGDLRDPARMLVRGIRGIVRIPARYALVLAALHTLVIVAIGPLVRLLALTAMDRADIRTLTVDNFAQLISSPVSLIFVVMTVAIVVCATFVLSATLFVVADLQLSHARPSLPVLFTRVAAALRTLCRPESVLLALTWCVLAPVAGFALFTPLTSGLALPPFIGREFAKTALGSVGLHLAGVALVYLYFRSVLTFPLTVVTGRRPAQTFLSSLTATHRGGFRLAVLLGLGYTVTWLASRLATTLLGLVVDGLSVVVGADVLQAAARYIVGLMALASSTLFGYLLVAEARRVARLAGVETPVAVRRARPSRRALFAGTAALGLLTGAFSAQTGALAETQTSSDALVIAHRGYDSGGVENTLGALDAAAPFNPDLVEVDIQQTGDGGFVASHDTNLFVLAGLNRNIYEMTTAEVTSTTVRMKGMSDRIPTMTDFVLRAQELGQPLLIELKVTGHEKPGFVRDLLAELDSVDALESNTYHSLSAAVVSQITRLQPDLRVGLTLGLLFGAPPLALDVDFYTIEQSSYTTEFVDGAHALGREVYVWTVNGDLGMRRFLRDGADGLVTDRLTEANRYRALIGPDYGYLPGDARDELLAEDIWR
jgi:glycerophosphoryl diester phosphodiesterase